jgi:BirA family biotin operon repressor/biotin-[acetyl-CoA-carboxylase] ligase
MELPESSRLASRLCILDQSLSTNTELVRRVREEPAEDWPNLSVLATDTQTGGHGRHERVWISPSGTALAASVLVRPRGRAAEAEALGWLPLVAGLAMTRAISSLGVPVGLKWPNDVLATDDSARPGKLVGILVELVPTSAGLAAVIGTGVNLTLRKDQLPVPGASSLVLCGVGNPEPDAVFAPYLAALASLVSDLEDLGPEAGSIRSRVREACTTLGRPVRVETPGGMLTGTAVDIDEGGRIVIENGTERIAVSAGDVTHLRY